MDAHVFRRLGQALIPLLEGARLEKIQSPANQVFVLTFYAHKRKQHLIFKASRNDPFLYIATQRPHGVANPSAQIMRMRKYCAGRRIAACALDWLNRRLLLLFRSETMPGAQASTETWLILNMREGLELVLGSCPALPDDENIVWPSDMVDSLLQDEHWRQWPMLTPGLRRTMALLEPLDQSALLADLEIGGGDIFVYEPFETPDLIEASQALNSNTKNTNPKQTKLSAWPLPPELMCGYSEKVFEDPIVATTLVGDELVLGGAAKVVQNANAVPHQREMNRLKRLLDKLNDEENRLTNLVGLQELGIALQNIMWRYDPQEKHEQINSDNAKLGFIKLNPRLTLSENMQAFFHQASRGKRGLKYLVERRESLNEQLHALNNTVILAQTIPSPKKANTGKTLPVMTLPKGVEAFYSSDNFVILRGKDAKGNWAALRMAAAQDLWLHVDGGPGAHCIIRRHFVGQEIPEQTLKESAALAAIKSWQRDNQQAQIISAEVRHVKPMRNAPAGTVRIDKVWRSFTVSVLADIEEKLLAGR